MSDISEKNIIDHSINALQSIRQKKHLSTQPHQNQICDGLMDKLCLDIHSIYLKNKGKSAQPYSTLKNYLDLIFLELPAGCIKNTLENFAPKISGLSKEIIQAIIIFLIQSKKPVFQFYAVKLIQEIKDDGFSSLIIDFLFSTYAPLSAITYETILIYPGNAVSILEQYTRKKYSKSKQEMARHLIKRIDPTNEKLALLDLVHEDFLTRIHAVEKLGATKKKKYINKITPMLQDTDLSVRRTAIDTLSSFGGKKARTILQENLKKEKHPPLQKSYIDGIVRC